MQTVFKRPILYICIVVIAVIFIIPFKNCFVFYEQHTNIPGAYLPLQHEKQFQMKYTHSIHLSDVIETYEIKHKWKISLQSLQYEDFAIGMPNEARVGEVFSEKDGKYFIENMNIVFNRFNILIGDVSAELIFIYNGEEYDLKSRLSKGDIYTFQIGKLSLWQLMKGVSLHE